MLGFLGYRKRKSKINCIMAVSFLFLVGFSSTLFMTNFNEFQNPNYPSITIEDRLINLNNECDNSLNCSSEFEMFEYANITSSKNNISSIDIEMPSPGWNITDLALNFTDISVEKETVTIASEDELSNLWRLQEGEYERLAMQMTVTEEIKLISVSIYGFSSETPQVDEVFVKITDWNSGSNIPDTTTIYGSPIALNISSDIKWYNQKFPVPIDLTPGDYAIVLDGYPQISSNIKYYWFINESNSKPLYMSYFDYRIFQGWDWYNNFRDVFCHKITQWVNRSYNPSEINMSATLNGVPYEISNGYEEATGYLNITNSNIPISGTEFSIEITNNQSVPLNFNLIYTMHITNLKLVDSSVRIKREQDNKWKIFPNIERCSCDYSIIFRLPQDWYNISIYRNNINITSDPGITFTNGILQIKNDTIIPDSDWLVNAQNKPLNFTLNGQEEVYNPAEVFEITVQSTFSNGEYDFLLVDSAGQEKYRETKEVSGTTEDFSYIVRSDDKEGQWNALVFWNNQTDAGIQTLQFMVEIPFVLTPLLIFIISISSIGSVGLGYASYSLLKRRKKNREIRKRMIIDKCMDIVNLKYFLVTDKKSSLTLFDQKFVRKSRDPTLISGFLEAIRNFGIELTGSGEQAQIIKLEYKDLKIIMDEFGDFRIILIMKELPSNEFLISVKELSYEVDEKFGKFLDNFKGDVRPFKYIDRLVIKHLNGSLLYPLKLVKTGQTKISPAEKILISKILKLKKIKSTEYIYFRDLMQEKLCDPEEILLINDLIQKKILQPILNLN